MGTDDDEERKGVEIVTCPTAHTQIAAYDTRSRPSLPATMTWPSQRLTRPAWRRGGESATTAQRGWVLVFQQIERVGLVFQVRVDG